MTSDDRFTDLLKSQYDLGGPRSLDTHYYLVESCLDILSGKGVVKKSDVYRQFLKCVPGDRAAGEADSFTCARFGTKRGDSAEVTIPSLAGFTYTIDKKKLDEINYDSDGQFFGLPESKFKGLVDSDGRNVAFDDAYQIYSSFFYYHSYIEFAEAKASGKGVQDLRRIGDSVVDDSSGKTFPLPGSLAGKGSFWNTGEVILSLKGLTERDGSPCAMLGLKCSPTPWYMPINFMRMFGLKTYGLSSYVADICLDLQSKWVREFTMVLSEMTLVKMWGLIPVDRSFPHTVLTIREVSEEEFGRQTE